MSVCLGGEGVCEGTCVCTCVKVCVYGWGVISIVLFTQQVFRFTRMGVSAARIRECRLGYGGELSQVLFIEYTFSSC